MKKSALPPSVTAEECQKYLECLQQIFKQWVASGRHISEDDLQDILQKFLKCNGAVIDRHGHPIRNLINWARRTISFSRLQEYVRQSRHVYYQGLGDQQCDALLPATDRPDVNAHLAEISRHLPELLERFERLFQEKLRGNQRKVVILWHVDRVEKWQHIAIMLGLKVEDVWKYHFNGMQRLYDLLQKELEQWPTGCELFAPAFADPKNLSGLFALRMIQSEGANALDSAIQSTYSKMHIVVMDKRRRRKN